MKTTRSCSRVLAATILVLLAGCSTTSKTAGPKYIFFPPPPDPPRLQFLTSFSSEKDLRGGHADSFLTFVTGAVPAEKPIGKPYGAALSQNRIYVCDTGARAVLKLDLETRRITAVASTGPAALKVPLNITIDADGTSYIADSGRHQVVILDKNENLVAVIGEKGAMKPRDVALTRDRIYIADFQSQRVQVYDKATRKPLFAIPSEADAADLNRKLFQPGNLAVDSVGRVYVSDVGAFRVQVYDRDGKYIRTMGKYGDNIGEFARPKGVALDRENRLYTVDAATQVVQMFDDQGQLLMWFGEPKGSRVGLELPAKVVVDYDHVKFFERDAAPDFKVEYLVVVINQYGPRLVSVFGFGHKK